MNWDRHRDSWPHAAHSRFARAARHHWHIQEMGEGPTLLLIHGAGGATQSWRHLMPLLAQHYRCVAMDLPGQGFTKPGSHVRFGLEPMAKDIAALCEAEAIDPQAIISHSAGTAVALEIVRRREAPLPVVGINAALAKFSGSAGLLFPLIAKTLTLVPFVGNIFTAQAGNPASIRRMIAGTGSSLPEEDLAGYRALIAAPSHVEGTLSMMAQWELGPLLRALPELEAPVLLIAGEKDKTVPPRTSERVANQMPDAELLHLPDLGHLAHEEDAGAVAAPILTFLRAQGL